MLDIIHDQIIRFHIKGFKVYSIKEKRKKEFHDPTALVFTLFPLSPRLHSILLLL
jgi:hypothetical protein